MAENTKIEWADHTWNFVWGCVEVSPACAHCYAKLLARRIGLDVWGADKPRRIFGDDHFKEPLKWEKLAKSAFDSWDTFRDTLGTTNQKLIENGHVPFRRPRVFCSSMADIGEDYQGCSEAELECQRALLNSPSIKLGGKREFDESRQKTWALIEATPNLDWLLLTKRPENMLKIVPEHWRNGFPANVVMMTTVENQPQADKRIPELLKIPAKRRGLSCEPLLGAVDLVLRGLPGWDEDWKLDALTGAEWASARDDREPPKEAARIHWVICGGESGPNARPMHPEWAGSLRDQCVSAGVPFFFKQWGEWAVRAGLYNCGPDWQSIDPRCQTYPQVIRLGEHGKNTRLMENCNDDMGEEVFMQKVGKKRAGRLLDGREWNEFPSIYFQNQ